MNATAIKRVVFAGLVLAAAAGTAACASAGTPGPSTSTPPSSVAGSAVPSVVAETSYLADIVQNVAGDRMKVESLLPVGTDPHSFDPTPRDAAKVAKARAVVINSPGLTPVDWFSRCRRPRPSDQTRRRGWPGRTLTRIFGSTRSR
jgi:ABC-type Zn uptake system ZnuABC Zn-binding protein ZnuA